MTNPKQIPNTQIRNPINIFIDESGTLPDPKDKYIVICGVGAKQIKEVRNIISRTMSSIRQGKTRLTELKFYYSGQNTKRQFLSGLISANFDIFALVIDKKGRKIADTPENFCLLVADLINEVHLWYKSYKLKLIIDKHFHKRSDQNKFDNLLKQYTSDVVTFQIVHVDSQKNTTVNTADMAAGAVLWKYSGKDSQYYQIIKDNIVVEKIVNWPELKRNSLINKKLT